MRQLFYIFAVVLLVLVFWHIPLSSTVASFPLHEVYAFNAQESIEDKDQKVEFVWHRQNNDLNRHTLTLIDKSGNAVRTLVLPPEKLKRDTGEEVKISSTAAGYLTYPENGEYFIWFPQLGSSILYFDSRGRFIWDRAESRYLQAFPDGKFVMAAAGDHSRVDFLTPNLDSLFTAEGLIFTQYFLQDAPERGWHAAVVFINGVVQLFDLKNKFSVKVKLPGLLKGTDVDLQNGTIAGQMEEKSTIENNLVIRDIVYLTEPVLPEDFKSALDNESVKEKPTLSNFETVAVFQRQTNLPEFYPYSLPVAQSNGQVAFLVPTQDGVAIRIDNGTELRQFSLSMFTEASIESLRLSVINDHFLIFAPDLLAVASDSGIYWFKKFRDLQNIQVSQNRVIVNSERAVYAYSVGQ